MRIWKRSTLLRQFVVSSVVFLMLISAAIDPLIALGQLPSLTPPSQPLPVGVERQGALESAGVHLDRKELFSFPPSKLKFRQYKRLKTQ